MSGKPEEPSFLNPYQAPSSSVSGGIESEFDLDWMEPAPRWKRLVAGLIDMAIAGAIGIVVAICYSHFMIPNSQFTDEEIQRVAIVMLSSGILAHLLINLTGWKCSSQSLGKKVFGIRIVRKDGGACSVARILGLRTLPFLLVLFIPGVGILAALIDLMLIFREDPYCLHDDMSDTMVVHRVD